MMHDGKHASSRPAYCLPQLLMSPPPPHPLCSHQRPQELVRWASRQCAVCSDGPDGHELRVLVPHPYFGRQACLRLECCHSALDGGASGERRTLLRPRILWKYSSTLLTSSACLPLPSAALRWGGPVLKDAGRSRGARPPPQALRRAAPHTVSNAHCCCYDSTLPR